MCEIVAVVVAAGDGVRLGAGMPKALVQVAGRPLVWHAVKALLAGGVERIAVAITAGNDDAFRHALDGLPVSVYIGGARRQDSVRRGLDMLDARTDAVVLVHDAARPFVGAAVVRRVGDAVRAGAEAVVPALPVVDSMRLVDDAGSTTIDRATLRAVQTPQGFRFGALAQAHAEVARRGLEVTDDAAALEAIGGLVTLVDGDRLGFKITERADLLIAEALVKGMA